MSSIFVNSLIGFSGFFVFYNVLGTAFDKRKTNSPSHLARTIMSCHGHSFFIKRVTIFAFLDVFLHTETEKIVVIFLPNPA